MATVEKHYDEVLSDVYAWMYGGFDAAVARFTDFLTSRGIAPRGSRRAIDLGAGCGFQSIPLAHLQAKRDVTTLFAKVHAALEPGGAFIVSFRDLSVEAMELDRFIPVRSDDDTVFTCFLEVVK